MKATENNGKFAVILKGLMVKNRVSHGELADAIGASRATITNYVKGKYTPSQQTLEKIASYLNVSPKEFFEDETEYIPFIEASDTAFSTALSSLMKDTNVTQEQLAKHIGVSRQTINYYVHGKIMPKKDAMEKICKYFGKDMEYFIGKCEKAKNATEMKIYVTKMPTDPNQCLFVRQNSLECKFGGMCDVENCPFLCCPSETTNEQFPF